MRYVLVSLALCFALVGCASKVDMTKLRAIYSCDDLVMVRSHHQIIPDEPRMDQAKLINTSVKERNGVYLVSWQGHTVASQEVAFSCEVTPSGSNSATVRVRSIAAD